MKLKKLLITGLLAIALTTTLQAQNYQSAFGVRLGYDSGLTYKNFFSLGNAFEGILSASPHHFQLTGLYEYQQPVPGAPSLDWYLGLGAHLGGLYDKGHRSNGFLLGADIILVPNIFFHKPLLPFRSDWKPSINFINDYNDYWYAGFALSLRYRFN